MEFQITFATPEDITDPGMDGIKTAFPFTIIECDKLGQTDQNAHLHEHRIIVPISRTCLSSWGIIENSTKVLFEIGRRFLEQKLAEEIELSEYSIRHQLVSTETFSFDCPFSDDDIPEPTGFSYRYKLPKSPIGFHP